METLAAMPKYSGTKDAGADWIQNIPENWTLAKIKNYAGVYNGDSLNDKQKGKYESEELNHYPYISSKDIDVNNAQINYLNGLRIPKEDKYKICPPNSTLMCIEGGSAGKKVAFTNQHVCFVNKLACFVAHRDIDSRFLYYYLTSKVFKDQFFKSMTGLIGGVAISSIKNFGLVLPSLVEQTSIAKFLDSKIAQLDEAIDIKEKQIALLKERKQIITQKAVTQGLDPNVPMKDSGVEWIGEIPEHWEIIKLKHLFRENTVRSSTGTQTLFSLRMEIGLVPHNDVSDKHIPSDNLIDYKIVQAGQLVMNRMRAAIGIFGLADNYGLVSPDYAVFDVVGDVNSEYYLTLFKLPLTGTQFRLESKGMGTGSSGFMRLYTENFGNIKVPNPSLKEQEELMQFISETEHSCAAGRQHLQTQIEKLKEYKTTLINSAVTGKIKVA